MLQITIWDNDALRIAEIDRNLQSALSELKAKGLILSNSESPLLARENLIDRVPVLEIAGNYWSKKTGKVFSKAECLSLLSKFKSIGEVE
jgi:hypothetical protein